MKFTWKSISNGLVILCIAIFIGLSFGQFYTVTVTGSVIDELTGTFAKNIVYEQNNWISIFMEIFPVVSLIVRNRWTNIIAIISSCFNILFMIIIYPFLISLGGIIGASYSANLAVVGWVGVIVILFMVFLLFYRDYQYHKHDVVSQ